MTKPIVKWILSFTLCAISLEGLLALRSILASVDTTAQYLVVIFHIGYVMAGIAVATGIWNSARSTRTFVIIWGLTSLGAAIGGPAAFGPSSAINSRAVIGITLGVLAVTSALLWYVHRITHD